MFKNTTRWEKMVKIGQKKVWGRESHDPLEAN